jgi:hypothetical protein
MIFIPLKIYTLENLKWDKNNIKTIILYFFIMENTQIYIKTDNNKIINEKCIKWVEKMGECLEVCTKSIGFNGKSSGDTHKLCFEVCTKSIGCHGKSSGDKYVN